MSRAGSALLTARVAAVLAATSLVLSATGLTPADAARAVARALSAKNADAVDGISASRTPRPGHLLALGQDAKLPPSVLGGTHGPRGAAGPVGVQGVAGPPGPDGPVDVITTKQRSVAVPGALNAAIDIVQMILPAGNWFLIGSGSAIWDPGPGSVYFSCSLTVGATSVDSDLVRLGDNANASLAQSVNTQGAATVSAPTTARMSCGHDQTAAGNLRVEGARISAFRVTSITTQNGDGT